MTAAPSQPRSGDHLPPLDAVRGLAIAMVMFDHFSVYDGLGAGTVLADRVVRSLAGAGWIGVDLFFVLSGFLITGILYDSKRGARYFRNFYARRVLRIFPVYYAALVIFLVVLPRLLPDDRALGSLQHDGVWYWSYLINYRIAKHGFPWFPALGHFWSLAIEEQFYLVWPAVVFLADRASLMRICLLCIVGSLAIRVAFVAAGYGEAAYVLTPARMDALAVGGLLALLAREPGGLARLARPAVWVTRLLGAAFVLIFAWRGQLAPWDPVMKTAGHTLLALLFGGLLVVALTSPPTTRPGRFFGSSGLRFLGKYSYALYVFHVPILFFHPGALLPLDSIPTIFGSLLLKKLVFVASLTAASLAIALTSWHLCEKQFLKLKRYFPYQSAEARSGSSLEPAPAPTRAAAAGD